MKDDYNQLYSEPLFRPPSEAYSVILQATHGCSWNRCAFCEMYSAKKYQVKDEVRIMQDIDLLAANYPDARKVFIADGDAINMPTPLLLKILHRTKRQFPKLQRVSVYASPKNLLAKTFEELEMLSQGGLKLLYIGPETGDDILLKQINKGETADSMKEGIQKAHAAGINSSVMIINGLGGKERTKEHARASAKLINECKPQFLSTLVLSFPFGIDHFKKRYPFPFTALNTNELLEELHDFISQLQLEHTIFRSDHASNYLSLKGTLNKDKESILSDITVALNRPDLWRPESFRGL